MTGKEFQKAIRRAEDRSGSADELRARRNKIVAQALNLRRNGMERSEAFDILVERLLVVAAALHEKEGDFLWRKSTKL